MQPGDGRDLAGLEERTVDADPDLATLPSSNVRGHASGPGGPVDGHGFAPGTLIGDRYRIVGLLGRGGMGEVFRADDLRLGQPVALKFLPADVAADQKRLARFRAEVRTSLQVTHANVCRVYDLGEVAGRHFLSMEYVDGEDLASLLRRIGRLPQERAVEVARQICAGLSAAHDQGILHRDLKPANIMLDGRGQVRLTDFGLAAIAETIDQDDVRSGTPAYQAPEQLEGREVTVRSDIYALGLVLYELFTGKRAFAAGSLAELRDLHASATPANPSSHVSELDPVVERAIMRCLEKAPADRPASALAVAAALPGGDPLAAALAAGEVPSPELVAQAGERAGMRRGRALSLAAAAMVLVAGVTWWAGSMSVAHHLPLERRPEVLLDLAQGVLRQLGYTEPVYRDPLDRAWGFLVWSEILDEVARADSSANRWATLRERPDAVAFWYRQSPFVMMPSRQEGPVMMRGPVSIGNPQPTNPAEVVVMLDLAGRLRRFEVMPRRFSALVEEPAEPDWAPLFTLAGLDTARFDEVRPRYQRFMAPDQRRAWVGSLADRPQDELRVEAGSFEGRPVLFNVTTSASLEGLAAEPTVRRPGPLGMAAEFLQPALFLAIAVLVAYHVRRNTQRGRADQRGAVRFGWAIFVLFLAGKGLQSHVLFTFVWASEVWVLLVGATFSGMIAWGSYLAAEPMGRQVWPTMFVPSSRLLSRARVSWRDPLVGQSVLVGVMAGMVVSAVTGPVRRLVESVFADGPPALLWFNPVLLQGPRRALAVHADLAMSLAASVLLVMLLVVLQYVIRRRWLALSLTLLVWAVVYGDGATSWGNFVVNVVAASILLALLLRFGAVAYVVAMAAMQVGWHARVADWSAWYAEGPLMGVLVLGAFVLYGYWAATGQRRS